MAGQPVSGEVTPAPDVAPRCGLVVIHGRTEWVCVRLPHDDGVRPAEHVGIDHAGPHVQRRRDVGLPAEVAEADRHWFVSRWGR